MSVPATTAIETRIASALNTTAVASAAGFTLAAWTTPSHVFNGCGLGLIGARNRGRMPYINYGSNLVDFQQTTVEGGTLRAQATLEVIVGGVTYNTSNTLAQLIMSVAFSQIRSEASDNYMALGDDHMGQLEVMPWGHRLTGTIDVEYTYDRATYQVQ